MGRMLAADYIVCACAVSAMKHTSTNNNFVSFILGRLKSIRGQKY